MHASACVRSRLCTLLPDDYLHTHRYYISFSIQKEEISTRLSSAQTTRNRFFSSRGQQQRIYHQAFTIPPPLCDEQSYPIVHPRPLASRPFHIATAARVSRPPVVALSSLCATSSVSLALVQLQQESHPALAAKEAKLVRGSRPLCGDERSNHHRHSGCTCLPSLKDTVHGSGGCRGYVPPAAGVRDRWFRVCR